MTSDLVQRRCEDQQGLQLTRLFLPFRRQNQSAGKSVCDGTSGGPFSDHRHPRHHLQLKPRRGSGILQGYSDAPRECMCSDDPATLGKAHSSDTARWRTPRCLRATPQTANHAQSLQTRPAKYQTRTAQEGTARLGMNLTSHTLSLDSPCPVTYDSPITPGLSLPPGHWTRSGQTTTIGA